MNQGQLLFDLYRLSERNQVISDHIALVAFAGMVNRLPES